MRTHGHCQDILNSDLAASPLDSEQEATMKKGALILLLSAWGMVTGLDAQNSGRNQNQQPQVQQPELPASSFISSRIVSIRGQEIGRITDLVIDPTSGTVTHIVMFLNNAYRKRNADIYYNIDETAPQVCAWGGVRLSSEGRWVLVDDSSYSFRGTSALFMRATQLANSTVQSINGPVGQIFDLFIQADTGKISSVALSTGERIPWSDLTWSTRAPQR